MEADDLDSLIEDSLGGVQSALEGEKKGQAAQASANSSEWAKEAVQELKDGSKSADSGPPPNEEFFTNLIKTFQDDNFQKSMAEALQGANLLPEEAAAQPAVPSAAALVPEASPAPKAASSAGNAAASSSGSAGADGAEQFLQKFLQNFDQAVGSDGNFEKSLNSLMTSMLSNELICEPLKQIADKLEPWLKTNKNLSQSDRSRYEGQLRLYKQILHVYSQSPDPLPDAARDEVQRLLTELHSFGQPPDEILQQVSPKEAEDGNESFEDFVKSIGLDGNFDSAQQEILKKLEEDPEELTKALAEDCKQQ